MAGRNIDREVHAFIDRSIAERRHQHAVEALEEIERNAADPSIHPEGAAELAVSQAVTKREMAALSMWLTEETETEVA